MNPPSLSVLVRLQKLDQAGYYNLPILLFEEWEKAEARQLQAQGTVFIDTHSTFISVKLTESAQHLNKVINIIEEAVSYMRDNGIDNESDEKIPTWYLQALEFVEEATYKHKKILKSRGF